MIKINSMNLSKKNKLILPSFPFYLRRSTYIHALLLAFFLVGGKVALEISEKKRNENVELLHASVRVDMVAMPTQTLNELKSLSSGVEEAKPEEKSEELKAEKVETKIQENPEEKPAEIAEDKNDPTQAFEEAQIKKRQDFLNKLKTLGNKKVESTGTQKSEKGLYGDKESALKNLVLSGNKVSKGTQMYGEASGGDLTAFQAYATRLPDFVRPHWKLPSFLMNKNLKCRIRVWLNMNGEVTRAVVYQTSGEGDYDQKAIEAIKMAAPFPALKEEYGTRAQNGDILLGFPL
jgi:colicin import membrane protein